jgi:hypothetical protein
MAEAVASGPIQDAAKLTDAEIQATRRGLTFAMWLTAVMATASITFFAIAVSGIGAIGPSIIAGTVCLSVPVVMLVRSFLTRS